jgi:hypothetical protein
MQPRYFQKLAQAGVPIRTQEDAAHLWNIGCKLLDLHYRHPELTKVASVYAQAEAGLDVALNNAGMGGARPADNAEIKYAADHYAGDSDIYASILSLKLEEAARQQQALAQSQPQPKAA